MKKISLIIIIFVMSIILIDSCKNIEAVKEKRDRNIPCSILDEIVHVTHDSIPNPSIFSSRKYELFYPQDSSDEYAPVFVPNTGGLDTLYFVSSKIFKIPQRHSCFWDIIPFGWLFGYKPEPVIDNFVLYDKYNNNNTDIKHRGEVFYSTREHSDELLPWENWSKPNIITSSEILFNFVKRGPLATHNGKYFVISADKILYDDDKNFKGHSEIEDLYEITYSDGVFDKPKPINSINIDTTNESQPSLSPDGNTLFFVSDRDGGKGGLDIWYSRKQQDNSWGEPQPLNVVNSNSNEMYPLLDSDGRFYFSSDRKESLGGYDIFVAELDKSMNANSSVSNINNFEIKKFRKKYIFPVINTIHDERSTYIINNGNERIDFYFASNRPNGFGKYDIYGAQINSKPDTGKVKIDLICKVKINTECIDLDGNLVPVVGNDYSKIDIRILNKKTNTWKIFKLSDKQYLDSNTDYEIKIIEPHNLISTPVLFTTPDHDASIVQELNCTIADDDLETIILNDPTGNVPFFVTGYWWPLTEENWKKIKREKELLLSRIGFINFNDYEYEAIDNRISNFFNNEVYARIEKLIPLLNIKREICKEDYVINIIVDGYTDRCGIDTLGIYNGKEIVISDSRNNQIIIPENQQFLGTTFLNKVDGSRFVFPDFGQQGNVLLSMLRAYFTKETIHNHFYISSNDYRTAFDNSLVRYEVNGNGIYNRPGVPATGITSYWIGAPSAPSNIKPCNNPEHRRIEISIDIIPKGYSRETQEPYDEKCFRYVELVCNDSLDASTIIFMLNQYSSNFFVGNHELSVKSIPGSSKYCLESKGFSNISDVNLILSTIQYTFSNIDILKQKDLNPQIKEFCNPMVISFGRHKFEKFAKNQLKKLESIFGNYFCIVKITNGTDEYYSVRTTSKFYDKNNANAELNRINSKLIENNIRNNMELIRINFEIHPAS